MTDNRNQMENNERGFQDMENERPDQNSERNEGMQSSGGGRKSSRGFASMDPERQRQIASEGGRAAHRQGVAHKWNSQEASQPGRKGGQNSRGGGRSRTTEENQ